MLKLIFIVIRKLLNLFLPDVLLNFFNVWQKKSVKSFAPKNLDVVLLEILSVSVAGKLLGE